MRAQLKSLHSPDIDLSNYWPEDPGCFGFLLQAFVGAEGKEGDDSFSFILCTPRWLELESKGPVSFGANHLIVMDYDLRKIEEHLKNYCERCVGDTWIEVAAKVGRVGRWEFEDYRPNG